MKKLCVIVVLFISFLVAAQQSKPLPDILTADLLHIDTLMQSRPDSALIMLMSADSVYLNNDYYQLLLAEALYKTGNRQINRYRDETFHETSLHDAMLYFDNLAAQNPDNDDITMLAARSHYMNGVGFNENDSVVEACKEYLNSLNIMESHFDEKDLVGNKAKFMSLTCNRLVELFSDRFMTEPAIYFVKKAISYCDKYPTSKYGMSNTIHKLGTYYDISGQKDSAYYFYKQALDYLPDSNNYVYRNILSNMALLSYDKDSMADKTISICKNLIKQAGNEKEKYTRYIGIGYVYYKEKVYDSALIYLKDVFENKPDEVMMYQSADYLCKIYQELDDSASVYQYEKYLAQSNTSKYDIMKDVSILDKIFNDYLEKQKYKQHIGNKTQIVSIIIIISVVLTIIILFFTHRNKRKINDANLKYDIEREKVTQLHKELVCQRSKTELCIEAFLNEPVCNRINAMITDIPVSSRSNYADYPNIKLDDNTIIELSEAVNRHFPNLKPRLLSNDINLKKEDLLLCYLYLLGLNNAQIAILRQYNYTTVFRQANRLKKSLKGCKDLPAFIKKLAVS